MLSTLLLLIISLILCMPLFSNWFGSGVTYALYLLGIVATIIFQYRFKPWFNRYDFLVFILLFLFFISSFYAINPTFQRELLFIPLLIVLYLAGKNVAISHLLQERFFLIMSLLIALFCLYLLYSLSSVQFHYNAYFEGWKTSNPVDYLTTAMYAGIVLLYTVFKPFTPIIRFTLLPLALFIILISGARFSIFFIIFTLLLIVLVRFHKIVTSRVFVLLSMLALISSPLYINTLSTHLAKTWESYFEYSLMRINHFDAHNQSLNERNDMIQKSIEAIDKEPFLGYGIGCSQKVIHYVYPHNMFLEVWLDTGILGFLTLLLISVHFLSRTYPLFLHPETTYLAIINLYVFLAHLKSFSLLHSFLLFFLFGLTFSIQIQNKKELA